QPVAQSLESGTGRAIDAVYFKSQTASGWQYGAQYVSPGVSSRFADATQYLLGTVASADSPDVVVIYRPHAGLILERAGRYRRREGGLGLQWDNQHIPLIVAGHGTYAGRTSSYPARLVDIAPTVEALLGLSAGTGDGEALRDGLIQPPAGADFQKASSSRLRTLTTALQNRARRAGS
ncbi:MAG TPA: hypothetical protein VF221_06995, partial [Chloroflexota bacterium]